jgi:hypothetical protein
MQERGRQGAKRGPERNGLDELADCIQRAVRSAISGSQNYPLDEQNMMITRFFSLVGLPALLLFNSVASAQGAWSYEPTQTSPYTTRPVEQYPPPSSVEQRASHRGYQGSFNLGVPIWLNADRDVVRPGVDLNGFGGFDMGYVAFGLGLGAMWTPINFYNIPGIDPGFDRRPMTRLYLAPEVRVQVPNNTPLLPYLGISFDANWWRVAETNVVCTGNFYYYCARIAVFRFTPGMTAKIGLAIRVASGSYIDLGVKYSLTGPGSFFFQREQWITPYVGMLFR